MFRSYHNFNHAFDVTQTLFAMFAFAEDAQLLTALEQVVMLLSAVCHDIAHPGVGNQYLVNANHPLAEAYGSTSVLENMHAAKTMQLIEKSNILRNLTTGVRRLVVRALCLLTLNCSDLLW